MNIVPTAANKLNETTTPATAPGQTKDKRADFALEILKVLLARPGALAGRQALAVERAVYFTDLLLTQLEDSSGKV